MGCFGSSPNAVHAAAVAHRSCRRAPGAGRARPGGAGPGASTWRQGSFQAQPGRHGVLANVQAALSLR